jgi:hypothetical protein
MLLALVALQISLAIPAFAFEVEPAADTLPVVMKEMGTVFGGLQRAINSSGDIGDGTLAMSQQFSALLMRAIVLPPPLDRLTPDAKEQKRLLALYKKVMAETLAASHQVEVAIIDGNLQAVKEAAVLLGNKRAEGHQLFRPRRPAP